MPSVGPVRLWLEKLKAVAAQDGLTLEGAADLLDAIGRVKGAIDLTERTYASTGPAAALPTGLLVPGSTKVQ